ncbi:tetratricopeptide repeat protein 29 [Aplochiton taeniatus]
MNAAAARRNVLHLPEIKNRKEKEKQSRESPGPGHSFRNSLRQTVCVDMLRKGFHRSFRELVSLLQRWTESRLQAGPGSAIWLHTPIDQQPNKLHTLQRYLTQGEAARRAGQWVDLYSSHLALARFFSSPADVWLSSHFYQASLESGRRVQTDGGRRHAEACGNMGRVYTEQGHLDQAREQFEAFYQLTAGCSWVDSEGTPLHSLACVCLWRVYNQLAQKPLGLKDYRPAIQTLTKAYDMAREASDKMIIGEAAHQLGLAYQSVGDLQTSKKFLNIAMEISSSLKDTDSLGKSYKAIAKSMESEGKLGETVQYLEKFAAVSQSTNQLHNLEEACMCLGVIFSARGQYARACEHFEKGYDIACTMGEGPLLQRGQVLVGTARAHSMIRKYSAQVEEATPTALKQLIDWKEKRKNQSGPS